MIRRIFTILSALSLVLCVVTSVMWARSASVEDCIFLRHDDLRLYRLFSSDGHIGWMVDPGDSPDLREHSGLYFQSEPTRTDWTNCAIPVDWHFVGFYSTWMLWLVPFWFIVVVTALPPLAWLANLLLKLRRQHYHLCLQCGYDLRATPERCPECGTATPAYRQKI